MLRKIFRISHEQAHINWGVHYFLTTQQKEYIFRAYVSTELPKHQWRAWENQKCLGKMTCCFCRPSGLLLNFLTVIIRGENDFKLLKKIVRGKEKKIMFFIACAIDWLVKFWVCNEMIPRKHQGKRVNPLYGDSWSLSYPNLLLAEKDFKGIQHLAPRKLGQARAFPLYQFIAFALKGHCHDIFDYNCYKFT